MFVCALRLYPATPGGVVRCRSVCLSSAFACAPPFLVVVLGCVCVCVCAPPVPRHSWRGCVVWGCVFGLGFWLRPATPGWAVGMCVCLCARSACTPPVVAGLCGVGVFVCGLCLYPATPGWGVRCGCVCLGSGFSCAPPLLAGVLGCVCGGECSACTLLLLAGLCGAGVCAWARFSAAPDHSWLGCWDVCVFVCALRFHPAPPGWGGRCGFVCLGSGFSCAPPLLAGVLGCVCVSLRDPYPPRHSWLACAVWGCVFGLLFRLRSATPGLGVWGSCVSVSAHPLYPATPGWAVRGLRAPHYIRI